MIIRYINFTSPYVAVRLVILCIMAINNVQQI